MYKKLISISDKIAIPVRVVAIAGNVIVLAIIFGQLFVREIFGIDFTGYEEIIMIFAAWLYFSASVLGSKEDSHIKADILSVTLKSEKAKAVVKVTANLFTLIIGIIFTVWAWQYISWLIEQHVVTSIYRIPTVLGESSLLICLILMSFYHFINLLTSIIQLKEAFSKKSGGEGKEVEAC